MGDSEQALRDAIMDWAPDAARLRALARWLDTQAAEMDALTLSEPDGLTYRAEYRRCGKSGCKCAAGALHGPYFYAYRKAGSRTTRRYVGRSLPTT